MGRGGRSTPSVRKGEAGSDTRRMTKSIDRAGASIRGGAAGSAPLQHGAFMPHCPEGWRSVIDAIQAWLRSPGAITATALGAACVCRFIACCACPNAVAGMPADTAWQGACAAPARRSGKPRTSTRARIRVRQRSMRHRALRNCAILDSPTMARSSTILREAPFAMPSPARAARTALFVHRGRPSAIHAWVILIVRR